MEDTAKDVERKIKKAYCAPGVVEGNPILDYVSSIVFPKFGKMTVERSPENGGNVTYETFEQLTEDFRSENLHPSDLKKSLTRVINEIIEPVRAHFRNDPEARKLLAIVKTLRVTKVKK